MIYRLLGLTLLGMGSVQADNAVTVVLDWTINTNHTGLYVAQELGYFKDEGLDVTIETPPETGGAAFVLSGSAQVSVSYQEEVTMARAAGKPLVGIAAIMQHNTSGFASRASAQITSAADFEGKRYGGWGSPMEEAMLKTLVSQAGGDPGKIDILPIGSMDFFVATENAVDFIWVFEGWDVVAANVRGIDINYIPFASVPALDYYTPMLASSEQWLKDNPDTAKAFLKAVSRGYEYAIEKPEEAAAVLMSVAPELDEALVVASQQFLAEHYQADAPRWGEMELSRWEAYAQWLREHELLEGEFVAHEAFSNQYLP